jgi:aminomethyltransferase
MADFRGWMMPIEYPGARSLQPSTPRFVTRWESLMFHIWAKPLLLGKVRLELLNSCLTNDLTKIEDGSAQYTLLCNPSGGVIDDLIAYRNSASDFFLVPNASNTSDVVAALS